MKKALVVDDEELILWFLERALKRHGYEVITARNIKEAFEIISKDSFDIIFTDLRMPEGNGTELLWKVSEITQIGSSRGNSTEFPHAVKTKVVVCSAFINAELLDSLKDKGIGILKKPFRLDELEALLKTA